MFLQINNVNIVKLNSVHSAQNMGCSCSLCASRCRPLCKSSKYNFMCRTQHTVLTILEYVCMMSALVQHLFWTLPAEILAYCLIKKHCRPPTEKQFLTAPRSQQCAIQALSITLGEPTAIFLLCLLCHSCGPAVSPSGVGAGGEGPYTGQRSPMILVKEGTKDSCLQMLIRE